MVKLLVWVLVAVVFFQTAAFADNESLRRQISSLDKMIQKQEQSGEAGNEKKIERLKMERDSLSKLITPSTATQMPPAVATPASEPVAAEAEKPTFVGLTAEAWMELGEDEKSVTVEQGLNFLRQRGLTTEKGGAFYESELRRVLGLESRMKEEPFLGILAFIVHLNEPQAGK